MGFLVVDPLNDATRWSAVAADGVTPSSVVTIVDDPAGAPPGSDGVCALLTASSAATGHAVRRDLAPLDLAQFTELRLSISADRTAGPPERNFFLELRLGSPALPLSDPANTWHRLIPVRTSRTWETVRCSIDDLPTAVSGQLTRIQLRCVDAPFVARLNDLTAVDPRPVADADAALTTALTGIKLGTTIVPVRVRTGAEPIPAAPAIDIVQSGLRFAPDRTITALVPRDFRAGEVRTVSAGNAYELDYAIRVPAATRADQTRLLETVLDRLGVLGELPFAGESLPIELVPGSTDPAQFEDTPVLRYRVAVRSRDRVASPTWLVREVLVDAHHLEV
ncbi:hypothetical protein ACQPXM_17655 [Kribbella sp. CA-253562]|uniref:hypothetical protein n=1 Tax=Kribbella sp. CA-253562 TaxID=3239942 RepID=UPI003D93F81E